MQEQWIQSQLEDLNEELKKSPLVYAILEEVVDEAHQAVKDEGHKEGDDEYEESLEYYIDNSYTDFKAVSYKDKVYLLFALKGDDEGVVEIYLTNEKLECTGKVVKTSNTLDSRQVDSVFEEYAQLILAGKIEED